MPSSRFIVLYKIKRIIIWKFGKNDIILHYQNAGITGKW